MRCASKIVGTTSPWRITRNAAFVIGPAIASWSISCSLKRSWVSVRMPPVSTSIGMPSMKASAIPLAACVNPAAGTIISAPIVSSAARLTASAMNAAPPSCVTSTGSGEPPAAFNSSYSSVLCTPGMPKV